MGNVLRNVRQVTIPCAVYLVTTAGKLIFQYKGSYDA